MYVLINLSLLNFLIFQERKREREERGEPFLQ